MVIVAVLLFVNVERLRLALVADQTQVPSGRLRARRSPAAHGASFSTELVTTALKDTPVVMVTGPRQCGKTTLVRDLVATDREFSFGLLRGQWMRIVEPAVFC